MNPSLEDIQSAINTTAKKILGCAKKLKSWGMAPGGPATFYDRIASDREIVKVVLLLTGELDACCLEIPFYEENAGDAA